MSLDLKGEKEPCKELEKNFPGPRISRCKSPEEGIIKEMWSRVQHISLQGAGAQGCEVASLLQGMRAADSGERPSLGLLSPGSSPRPAGGPSLLLGGHREAGPCPGELERSRGDRG